ncbi:MAG: glycosyltransferase family 2 protein [Candidatus Synoicihabitans palmerolidicus]|nr:glycosyltransferase family 2 protein [Candidatus Synoicihabitans palmerolidicus]
MHKHFINVTLRSMLSVPHSLPSISVVIPLFNAAPYIREAVQSILHQSLPPTELIVVDAGSTDDSAEKVPTDRLVTLIHHPHLGIAATLNRGIEAASGELLAFLDADDRWLPQKLGRQVTVLQTRPEIDMVFTYARICVSSTVLYPFPLARRVLPLSSIKVFPKVACSFDATHSIWLGNFPPRSMPTISWIGMDTPKTADFANTTFQRCITNAGFTRPTTEYFAKANRLETTSVP